MLKVSSWMPVCGAWAKKASTRHEVGESLFRPQPRRTWPKSAARIHSPDPGFDGQAFKLQGQAGILVQRGPLIVKLPRYFLKHTGASFGGES